jgi:hypothetical protein
MPPINKEKGLRLIQRKPVKTRPRKGNRKFSKKAGFFFLLKYAYKTQMLTKVKAEKAPKLTSAVAFSKFKKSAVAASNPTIRILKRGVLERGCK